MKTYPTALGVTLLLMFCFSAAVAQEVSSSDENALTAQTPLAIEPLPATVEFVPQAADVHSFTGGALILRPNATVRDSRIHLKNICRWSEADTPFFAAAGDLTVARFAGNRLYANVTLADIRTTLNDAGMNLAMIRIGGAVSCSVNRTDTQTEDRLDLEDWISTNNQAVPAAARETVKSAPPAAVPAGQPLHALRDILAADLAARLQVDVKDLEMAYNADDDKILNLAEPYFKFQITPLRVTMLGNVSWDVIVVANGERHKTTISATARLWQTKVVLTKPISYRQVIRDGDIEEKRVLIEHLSDEPLITKSQALGQSASRELKPGAILTASMVDPVLLARPGQLITVTVVRGNVKITAVAKAIEGGSFGQTIRVHSDVDPTQTFEVMLTGPQVGTVTGSTEDKNPSPVAAAGN